MRIEASESSLATAQPAFTALMEATLKTVARTTQRVYGQTYRVWGVWCVEAGLDPLELTFANVAVFLEGQAVGKATRQRQLSALRKLAEMLAILDYGNPAREAAYKSLMKLRVGQMEGSGVERDRHALTPAQADKVLRVWTEGTRLHRRNRALMAVLFLAGLRRSEAAALRWKDINLDDGLIHIRHGKGDVERDVVLAGEWAVEALRDWRLALGEDREYVFPSMAKGDKLGADAPTDAQTVYRVVKATEQATGIEFSPHTARRTFITEALTTGAPLADVQAQAGHQQAATTLRYARPVDALQRKSRLRLRYG
jgi:integrase